MNNAIGNNTITQRDGRIEDDKLKHDIPMKRPKSEQMMKTTTDTTLPSSSVLDEDVNDEMRWRRNWQPDLKCCPWRFLQADQYVYLVKANFLPDSYEFLITDLNHFWYESITETEFSKRLQELNPNLEAPSGKILDHIKMNLEQNSSDNLSISKEEGKGRLNIWINSDLSGFPFCWQMIGESAHQEMVSENTTIPLLMMVSELYRRQKALIQIIDEKDREIDNYKAQGCKLTKKNISTVPFDETSFECSMVSSQEFEDNIKLLGTTAFERPGQNLYQHIMTKYTWLHRSTKIEPELLSKSSLEEPNTVFQQLEELSASVEGEEFLQVGKVEIDDEDEQVSIYECPQCIFSTVSQDLLVQHMNIYHSDAFVNTVPNPAQQTSPSISLGVTSPLHLQPLPQTPLSSQSPMAPENNPNNTSHEAGNISCLQCGQRYKTQYGLQSHMNSKHMGRFLFNCSLCGRGFDSYRTYKTHIDRHSILAEKCDRCNLTFRFKKSLVMHRRFCGKTKNQSTDLYRCQICEQTCSSKDSLSTHMRGQHGSQHYRCRHCNKVYKWRSSLKYHTEKCFRKPPNFLRTCAEDQQSMLLVQV